jgi:hypothetical protein
MKIEVGKHYLILVKDTLERCEVISTTPRKSVVKTDSWCMKVNNKELLPLSPEG